MPSLFARQNPLDDARNTFSSWDNCMAKNYCKWPVIVAIVVGSLILISVITCVVRCVCCGAECACCCFRCCTCCCSGSGRSGHKRVKSEPTPTYPTSYGAPSYAQAHVAAPPPPIDTRPINQQYRSNAMPSFGVAPTPKPERPQFATFDSTRAVVNDDSLPAMPTWKEGRDVHVQVEEQPIPEKRGDMELDRLNHNGSVTNSSLAGMAAVPGARRSPGVGPGRSPVSPIGDNYGFPPGYQHNSPHHNSPGPYGGPQDDYRRGSPSAVSSLVSGGGYTANQNQPHGRRSPGQTQGYDAYDDRDQYRQQDRYHQQSPSAQRGPYDPRDFYDDQVDRYQSPAPQPAAAASNTYHNNYQADTSPYSDPHDAPTPAPAPVPQRSYTPLSASTRYEPSNVSSSAYPGQQTYNAGASAYPGQQSYQAFQPSGGVARKPVDGSYRDF